MSCCVLHNLCIRQRDVSPEYFDNNDDQQDAVLNVLGNVAGVFKETKEPIDYCILAPIVHN